MDAFFDKIEHSTFDGLDRRTLERITQMTHPFGLTIFGGKSDIEKYYLLISKNFVHMMMCEIKNTVFAILFLYRKLMKASVKICLILLFFSKSAFIYIFI